MPANESIAEYYQRYGWGQPAAPHITAYRVEDVWHKAGIYPHVRRAFYKIKLLCNAQGFLHYADRRVAVQSCALVFANPLIPYSWERTAGHETGYACLFTEEFITPQLKTPSVAGLPLFRVGGTPVLFPPPETVERLSGLFEAILTEVQTSYAHKYELLRNYVQLILHESLKLSPSPRCYQSGGTSAARLSALFFDLLDQQLALASPQQSLPLKNANEFARQLAVHPNQLTKALKQTTGKTTTAHLAERLLSEAKLLLQHSAWSIAEIGYCLGFEYASSFIHFFKKHTGQPPHHYRQQVGVLS